MKVVVFHESFLSYGVDLTPDKDEIGVLELTQEEAAKLKGLIASDEEFQRFLAHLYARSEQ